MNQKRYYIRLPLCHQAKKTQNTIRQAYRATTYLQKELKGQAGTEIQPVLYSPY